MKKMFKLLSVVLVVGLLSFTLLGCVQDNTVKEEESKVPERIVSLTPSNTEILYALGLGDKVVGVTAYCDYPAEAANVEKIGDYVINTEAVVALEPDLVVAVGSMNSQAVDALTALGVNVLSVEPQDINTVFEAIKAIGEATGTEAKATELVDTMKAEIAEIEDKVATIPQEERKRVFIEVGFEPLFTAGKGSYIHELLTIAGGVNIAEIDFYSEFSSEKVIELNPEAILLTGPGELSEMTKRPGWANVDAIKNGSVSDIDSNLLIRQGPRVVEGITAIVEFLYPGLL